MANKSRSVTASKKLRTTTPPALLNFDVEIDVKAEEGAFVFSVPELYLQLQPVPVLRTPSGLHAEAKIFVDLSSPAAEQRVALYFDAATQNDLDISFALSLTPMDAHYQPSGPKKVYELKWTTSPTKPAFLDGPVYLKDLKDPK